MMAPFITCFDAYVKGQKFESVHLPYRSEENIYIIQLEKSLTVVYSIKFDHQDDVVLGKVFLQEFKDARRQDKTLGAAPSVTFTQGSLPTDLSGMKTTEPTDLSDYGFVSLSKNLKLF
jgi:actin related protein 2/3 complex, subunit 2